MVTSPEPSGQSRSVPVQTSWLAKGFDYGEAREIAGALGLSEPVAIALLRRGLEDAEAARQFLRADEEHDPFLFTDMEASCRSILDVARAGGWITVHGDYDADGVAATAILVRCLREMGASVDWLIPDRRSEGYGLGPETVAELIRRAPALVVTVDCGIASPIEVGTLRSAGVEVIVTDHHEPKAQLPDCLTLHPLTGGYPFPHLCGAGVALKLADALRSEVGGEQGVDLDLAALATVADMVPLVGENRRIVKQGLERLRGGGRPGMRALMRSARVDPDSVGSQDLGFRLAPRINAAGRLYRADAGVELMLTEDPERADAIAAELERANVERRSVERSVRSEAEKMLTSLPAEARDAPAIVLAGSGWHPGVVGLVAGRMSDEHWKPTVLVALDDAGLGRGSGRSVPGYDLLAGLEAASEHLEQFGGHKMAAGLKVEETGVEGLRAALTAHVESVLPPGGFPRVREVDAFIGVGRGGMGIELAEQLEALGPFGVGNPMPRFMVPFASLDQMTTMGEEGRHARFEVRSGVGRSQAIAFGMADELRDLRGRRVDLEAEVEINRWAGSLEPRLLVRDAAEIPGGPGPAAGCEAGCGGEAVSLEFEQVLRAELAREPGDLDRTQSAESLERVVVDRRGGATIAALLELSSSGSTLVLCADASRRRELAVAADAGRFGGVSPAVVCAACGAETVDRVLVEREAAEPGLVLADWAGLERASVAALPFTHVVTVDPPPGLSRLGPAAAAPAGGGTGFLHLAWSAAEVAFARRFLESSGFGRESAVGVWLRLQERGGAATGAALHEAVCGGGDHPLSLREAALVVRSLCEIGACSVDDAGDRLSLHAADTVEVPLERSATFIAAEASRQKDIEAFDRLLADEDSFAVVAGHDVRLRAA